MPSQEKQNLLRLAMSQNNMFPFHLLLILSIILLDIQAQLQLEMLMPLWNLNWETKGHCDTMNTLQHQDSRRRNILLSLKIRTQIGLRKYMNEFT